MIVVDNFVDCFDELVAYLKTADFCDEINPADSVVYPLICKDIPPKIRDAVLDSIERCVKRPQGVTMFMRRSPEGVSCPHKVHSDNSMGEFSLMLYIGDEVHGTSFLSHKDTGAKHVRYNQTVIDSIIKDQNNDDAWNIYQMNYAAANRAVIFDSHLLHRAEPVGGFGEGVNARTVLTCFFS